MIEKKRSVNLPWLCPTPVCLGKAFVGAVVKVIYVELIIYRYII